LKIELNSCAKVNFQELMRLELLTWRSAIFKALNFSGKFFFMRNLPPPPAIAGTSANRLGFDTFHNGPREHLEQADHHDHRPVDARLAGLGRPPAAPAPTLGQRVLASPIGGVLPRMASGATVLAAAAVVVGGGFAANAISDKLEGHKWWSCHWKYNENYARHCDNTTNDFVMPVLGMVPEVVVAAGLLWAAPKVERAVEHSVNSAKRAVAAAAEIDAAV
jgi:hypothetical protein